VLTSSARELGRRIGDPERTLPGENPRTVDALQARHWAAVHAELLEVRLELLQQLRGSIERVSDPLVAAGLRHNLQALELAVNRSRRRVAFWAHRLAELADAFAAPSAR
jgi:hypothetical protein